MLTPEPALVNRRLLSNRTFPTMDLMSFDGLRVLSFESRRATEMATLICNQKGEPTVAPAMREVPLESNAEALAFAERLFLGDFDMMILLTGVGTRYLDKILATRYPPTQFAGALRGLTVVCRGPKPLAVCKEFNIPVALTAPEPNTWREVLAVTQASPERNIAVQEYGRSNTEFLDALRARGRNVTAVPVYQWDFPEDIAPLAAAARAIAARETDFVIFTTGVQLDHLLEIAARENIAEEVHRCLARHVVIASIGPTTTEALASHDLSPDFEPTHPKMGFLIVELARQAAALHAAKQT